MVPRKRRPGPKPQGNTHQVLLAGDFIVSFLWVLISSLFFEVAEYLQQTALLSVSTAKGTALWAAGQRSATRPSREAEPD